MIPRQRSIALIALTLCAATTRAQEVTGIVRAEAGRAPLPGAIVILGSPSGARMGATLSDEVGRYRLRAPSAGTFTLRVDVVGYSSVTTPPFPIDSGASVTRDVLFPFKRTELPRVAVTASTTCARVSGDAGDAPGLWAEARKTLEAASLAIDMRRFNVAIRRFERTIGLPDSVLRASRTWTQTGVSQNPFESLSPETLARDGFSTGRDTARFYYAPDAKVLLSDAFVDTHCFGTRRGGVAGAVGLTFRPLRTGTRVDIDGVLWLDSATSELRTLEYGYVPRVHGQNVGGGFVSFTRYPSGVWGVQRWAIRLPVIHVYENRRRPDGALGRFSDTVVAAIHEVGGEVLAAGASIASASTSDSRFSGTVFDSTLGAPLPSAIVTIEGLGRTATTNSAGEFVFDSLAEDGEVRVRAWHPRLDSLGLSAPTGMVRLRRRAAATRDFTIPGVHAVRHRCQNKPPNADRVIMGTVRSGSDSTQPLPAVEVVLLERRGITASGADSLVRHTEMSNEVGRYGFCNVKPGSQAWLLVRTGSDWSEPRHVGDIAPPVEIVPLRAASVSDRERTSAQLASPGSPAVILGRTVGSTSIARVSGWVLLPENVSTTVQVLVDDVVRGTVSTEGSFDIGLVPVGPHKLTFRSPTLAIRHIMVDIQNGQSHLLVAALKLAPVVVVVQKPAAVDPRLADFRRRRTSGGGVFIDRAEIERRNPRTLTDLMRGVQGVQVRTRGGATRYVSTHFRRISQGAVSDDDGTCEMMIYLDGQPYSLDGGDAEIRVRVDALAAIEVYVSAASVPREYAGANAACGVILLWTRVS